MIDEISGKKSEVRFDKDRFGDLRYFVSDISKFGAATGWKSETMPREGIIKLIEWIRANLHLFDTSAMSSISPAR